MNEEQWKDINGYEGLYEISSFGRVRSKHRLRHRATSKDGIMKTFINRNGYECLRLSIDGVKHTVTVHKLVSVAFIKIENDLETDINHIDGNKANNHVENLERCTRSENLKHAYDIGLSKYRAYRKNTGIHVRCKKIIQMDINGSIIKEFESFKQAQSETNIKYTNISKVCRGLRDTAGGFKWKYKENIL